MSTKLSIAEVRRRLAAGTEFTAEFIGVNAKMCRPGMQKTHRRVVRCTTHELESVMLDGPKAGESIYLKWSSTRADQFDDGTIVLTMTETNPPEPFLRITLTPFTKETLCVDPHLPSSKS